MTQHDTEGQHDGAGRHYINHQVYNGNQGVLLTKTCDLACVKHGRSAVRSIMPTTSEA
jgi:hypothetical protein